MRAAFLGGVSAFAFFSIAMNTTQPGWLNWYRMAHAGVMTQAVVTSVHPEVHRSCTLRYSVDGASFETLASGCSDAAIGTSISLRYLPENPSFGTTQSPEAELLFQIFAAFLMSVLAAVITAFRVGKWGSAAQQAVQGPTSPPSAGPRP